jgi:hypothetical protein
MAKVKPNVAVAIPDLVGESFDLFGDGGQVVIVAKARGGAAVIGRGGVFEPIPGAGGFDWRISKIDVGGLDGSLVVVGACFPWGVFVLVCPCAAEGVQDRNQVRGRRRWLLCCSLNAVVGRARDEIHHMFKGTWVLTM